MATIAVAGAGIGGLAVALLMARRGHRVTVLEADPSVPPPGVEPAFAHWTRRGVPQLRQIHLFNALGCNVLRDRLPEVRAALLAAGAVEAPMDAGPPGAGRRHGVEAAVSAAGVVPAHSGIVVPDAGAAVPGSGVAVPDAGLVEAPTVRAQPAADRLPPDPDLVRINSRRTTYELVLRQAARGDPRIDLREGVGVAGLVAGVRLHADSGVPHVRGLRTTTGEEILADLSVDACGRASRLPAWLVPHGGHLPTRMVRTASSAYTRWYRAAPAAEPPLHPVNADLGYASGVLAPGDSGHFCITFGVPSGDPGLRLLGERDCFDAAVAAIPALAPHAEPGAATPLGRVWIRGDAPNRLRRPPEQDRPAATGLVALGDAAVCTNPGYGRGVGLALHHACRLDELFDRLGDDPPALAAAFAAVTRAELEPWFHDAVAADEVRTAIRRASLARPPAQAPSPHPQRAAGAPSPDRPTDVGDHERAARFAVDLRLAVERDPVVRRRFLRRWHLLDPPAALDADADIVARVAAVRRTAAASATPSPGPDHAAMVALMERARG